MIAVSNVSACCLAVLPALSPCSTWPCFSVEPPPNLNYQVSFPCQVLCLTHLLQRLRSGENTEVVLEWAGISVASLLRLLIQAGFNLNVQDNDGWTPLHAAAHWGVKEACSILAEALCDMDVRNKLVSKHCRHNMQLISLQDAV